MHIAVATKPEEVIALKPVVESWRDTCNAAQFGISLDLPTHIQHLIDLAINRDADLLIMTMQGTPIGYMGLAYLRSPLGKQRVATEHLWFVVPEHRGHGGTKLLLEAVGLAKKRGCTHLIMSASMLASDMHDKVCHYYEHYGLKKFETSFILRLEV